MQRRRLNSTPLKQLHGHSNDWQKHLRAAPSLFKFLRTSCSASDEDVLMYLTEPDLWDQALGTQKSRTVDGSELTSVDHAAVTFFTSVILWFDILACASTGRKPQYDNVCAKALGPASNSRIKIQEVMGCENWVMVLIREASRLQDDIVLVNDMPYGHRRQLYRRIESIKECFRDGIRRTEIDLSDSPSPRREMAVQCTTYVFACAGLVYVSAITGADPDAPDILDGVSRAVVTFEHLAPGSWVLRGLAWPFAITGCMANSEQRSNFSGIPSRKRCHGWKSFVEIMETCWRTYYDDLNDQRKCRWLQAMEKLGRHMLFV